MHIARAVEQHVDAPGHQVVATFEGFEPVTVSPTLRVDGSAELNELVFHLRLDRDGGGIGHAFVAKGVDAAKVRAFLIEEGATE